MSSCTPRQRLSFEISNNHIPYPEYSELSINLKSQYLNHREKIEVQVGVREGFENCFEDVVVEVQVISETLFSNLTYYKCSLFESSQHGATPFEEGLPPGVYEFPFVFRLPYDLPGSILLADNASGKHEGIELGSEFQGHISYKLNASVIHKKTSANRQTMRISAPFYRKFSHFPTPDVKPLFVLKPKSSVSKEKSCIKVELEKDVFYKDSPIRVNIMVKTLSKLLFRSVTASFYQVVDFEVREEDNRLSHTKRRRIMKFNIHELEKIQGKDCWQTFPVEAIMKIPSSGKLSLQAFDSTLAPSMCCQLDDGSLKVSYELVIHFKRHLSKSHKAVIPFIFSDNPGTRSIANKISISPYSGEDDNGVLSSSPSPALRCIEIPGKLLAELNYLDTSLPNYEDVMTCSSSFPIKMLEQDS